MTSATVRIPGTTANLGSGFDTLGLAVALYNRATVRRRNDRRVEITSPIAEDARAGALAMLEEAAAAFFKKTRAQRFGVDLHLAGDVPIARGLGSSVTARLGCVAGLNALVGSPLDRQGLLEVVAALEGHPDNAAPAVFGGFTAAGFVGSEVRCIRVPLPSRIRLVTLIPHFEVSTPEARKRVPQTFPSPTRFTSSTVPLWSPPHSPRADWRAFEAASMTASTNPIGLRSFQAWTPFWRPA